jgi:hypothetical protein
MFGTFASFIKEKVSPPKVVSTIVDKNRGLEEARTIVSSAEDFAESGAATGNAAKIISQQFTGKAVNKKDYLTEVTNAAEIEKINQVLLALYNQNSDSVHTVLLSWLLFADLITEGKENGEVFIPNIGDEWIENAKCHFDKKFRSTKNLKDIKSHFSFFQSVFQNSYVLRFGDNR